MTEALRALLAVLPAPRIERVPLAAANGRFLGADAVAPRDHWPFDRAAMDGIAVRAADVALACPEVPVTLTLAGSVYSGELPGAAPPGAAIRIATGAPLPKGADSVVPQELVTFANGTAIVARPIAPGKNVFRRGEDMRAGERIVTAGTRLRGAQVAALAALGAPDVPVFRRPRVAVIPCGDELLEPGERGPGARVADTNSFMLAAEIDDLGALAERRGIVPDEPERVRAVLAQALGADAIVTCGGLSVGERDYVRAGLRALGARFAFEGARIAPGSPAAAGTVDGVPFFALPGTPGACRVAFEAFARPALLTMLGAASTERPRRWARLTAPLEVRPGRTRFLWATLSESDDGAQVTPLADQGTATIRSASDADALIVLRPGAAAVAAGLAVETWVLGEARPAERPRRVRAAVAIVGPRNAGKTTLVERLIPLLGARGVRAGVIKRHGHMLALDEPHKDTGRAAAAGAVVTLLAGAPGYVARRAAPGLTLAEALAALHGADLALVEGFADSPLPKVRVARTGFASDREPAAPPIVAIAGDVAGEAAGGAPRFGWDEIERLADYLISRFLE